jgi:putative ABC transport system permease protein
MELISLFDLIECSLRELLRRKNRAVTNISSYALAVSIMVVLISVLLFSKEAESSILTSTGTHFVAFAPVAVDKLSQPSLKNGQPCTKKPLDSANEGFVANGVSSVTLPLSLVDQIKELPSVADATGYLLFRFKHEQDHHLFTVGGLEMTNTLSIKNNSCAASDIISGRFLQPGETGQVILEEAYAQARNLHVGDSVLVSGTSLPVVGIVNSGIRPAKADIYMSFDDAQRVIDKRLDGPLFEESNLILVEVKSAKLQIQAMDSVKKLTRDMVISSYNCYRPAATVLGINEGAVWLLTLIISLATIALSLKTQFATVIERRHDIGILKAIGWTNRTVVAQIVIESILQSFSGGILGCLIAMGVLLWVPIKQISGIETALNLTISWTALGSGLILALAGGIIAGIFPALGAARQNPAEALRRL